jgi:hypothetical protein
MCLPPGVAEDARRRALYVYCTIAQTAAEAVYFQKTRMVELVGIELPTSSLWISMTKALITSNRVTY